MTFLEIAELGAFDVAGEQGGCGNKYNFHLCLSTIIQGFKFDSIKMRVRVQESGLHGLLIKKNSVIF